MPRFVAACAEADVVLIADTGSRDDTVAVARAAGAAVHDISIRPWRFDDARNAALSLVPRAIHVCIALDLDEVPNPGWAEAVRRAVATRHHAGTVPCMSGRICPTARRRQYLSRPRTSAARPPLRHACHEAVYADRIKEKWVKIEDMQVDHWPDRGKSRKQYLDLLEATRDEDPDCARNSFHLGRELLFYERADAAEAELRRFLALPHATWKTQRAHAMRHIATCRAQLGDTAGELDWLRRAASEAPDKRDAWVALARALWRRAITKVARRRSRSRCASTGRSAPR